MNMRSNGGKARLALAVLGAACCAAGCGDSGADNSEIEQYAHEVQRALSQPDCRTIERINKRSVAALGAFPDIPCPKPAKAKATLRDFDIEATTAYGPVAVVDYTSRKSRSGTSMLLVRGPRGGWTLNTFGIGRGISSDTDDTESRAGFDRTAKEYLRASA